MISQDDKQKLRKLLAFDQLLDAYERRAIDSLRYTTDGFSAKLAARRALYNTFKQEVER